MDGYPRPLPVIRARRHPPKPYRPCAECKQPFARHHHGNEKYCGVCRWRLFGIRRGW